MTRYPTNPTTARMQIAGPYGVQVSFRSLTICSVVSPPLLLFKPQAASPEPEGAPCALPNPLALDSAIKMALFPQRHALVEGLTL